MKLIGSFLWVWVFLQLEVSHWVWKPPKGRSRRCRRPRRRTSGNRWRMWCSNSEGGRNAGKEDNKWGDRLLWVVSQHVHYDRRELTPHWLHLVSPHYLLIWISVSCYRAANTTRHFQMDSPLLMSLNYPTHHLSHSPFPRDPWVVSAPPKGFPHPPGIQSRPCCIF